MALRKRKSQYSKAQLKDGSWKKTHSLKEIPCSGCGEDTEVDENTISVVCPMCVQKRIPVDPKLLIQRGSKDVENDGAKPRGWRFMKEFVDKDGTVYHSGEEVPELKGTLPPTDVATIKAKQKEKSKERKAHKAEREEKKQAKLVKEFEKRKKQKEKEEKRKEKEMKKRLMEQNE